jgi:hypothetical protein
MALKIHYGLFEFLHKSFELIYIPAWYKEFINDILWPILIIFYIVFLNIIFIYNNNLNKQMAYVWVVMTSFIEARLYSNIEKWKFHIEEVMYFKLIAWMLVIWIDLENVQADTIWDALNKQKGVQAIVDIANLYW